MIRRLALFALLCIFFSAGVAKDYNGRAADRAGSRGGFSFAEESSPCAT